MSNFVQPYEQQPTRLLCPRDSPGKNTGVGCHFLLHGHPLKADCQSGSKSRPNCTLYTRTHFKDTHGLKGTEEKDTSC